jgi:hypothetical protein
VCACYPLQLARLKGRYEKKWIEDISINGSEDVNADAEFEAVLDKESGELEVREAYVLVTHVIQYMNVRIRHVNVCHN